MLCKNVIIFSKQKINVSLEHNGQSKISSDHAVVVSDALSCS